MELRVKEGKKRDSFALTDFCNQLVLFLSCFVVRKCLVFPISEVTPDGSSVCSLKNVCSVNQETIYPFYCYSHGFLGIFVFSDRISLLEMHVYNGGTNWTFLIPSTMV